MKGSGPPDGLWRDYNENEMGLFLLTAVMIAVVMLVMAVGLLFKYPCLRGSCGGPDVVDAAGRSLRCDACPRRAGKPAVPARP